MIAAIVLLAACGGGGGGSSGGSGPTGYTIGGTVTGLAAASRVTLQNNGADAVTVAADGSFTFPSSLAGGVAYAVTVQSHTPGVTCSVTGNPSGTVGTANVTNVTVTCAAGGESVVYSFGFGPPQDDDGFLPMAALITDSAGHMYGTTDNGGENSSGTVFKITPSGSETVLYAFGSGPAGATDGSSPMAGLVMDSAGNLYGTTANGGANNTGTVFKITPAGTETILHSFGLGLPADTDGTNPQGGLVMDKAGDLYGTTSAGGANGGGTVFKITSAGIESVVYSFDPSSLTDGFTPQAGLIIDSAGNLYGTSYYGGTNNTGTVFKIAPSGAETVLYSFGMGPPTDTDGIYPQSGLVRDSAGNLYGTTGGGGVNNTGTVFKLTPAGVESVLYSFGAGAPDAYAPQSGLVIDSAGNLYGTTYFGGANDTGAVFKVTPSGVESVLYSFGADPDAQNPSAGMFMDSAGNLYGTAYNGGASGGGAVFKID